MHGDGGVLDSGFNLVLLDFETGEQRVDQFKWNGKFYASKQQSNWSSLIRNPARERHLFRANKTYSHWLADTGTAFTHRRKRDLQFDDLFVYPDLQRWSVQSLVKGDKKPKTVFGKDVLQHFRETEYIFVTGSDDCGKTTLLKSIYRDLGAEFVPLWLSGRDLAKRFSETRFDAVLSMAIEAQYDRSSVERFMQLDPSHAILLIDDFHLCNLTILQQGKLMASAKKTASGTSSLLRPTSTLESFVRTTLCSISKLVRLKNSDIGSAASLSTNGLRSAGKVRTTWTRSITRFALPKKS